MTEWDQVESLVEVARERFGALDVVFANAGFGAGRGFLEESPEQWRSMVLTNVLGVAHTIRATLPGLLERDGGHYVITSSVAGRRALPGSLYSATKWAVTAMGESLRQELRQMHENTTIKVTCSPIFDTPSSTTAVDCLEAADIAAAALAIPIRGSTSTRSLPPHSQPI